MNASDWIALGSAVGAVAAAIVAISQARSAKDSAASARRQAAAAEEQLSLSRSQVEADIAARDEAEGPSFAIENAERIYDSQHYVSATLMMTGGRPLSLVKARVRGADVRWLVPRVNSTDHLEIETRGHVSPGGRLTLVAEMDWNSSEPVNLTFDLECLEEGGKQRTWQRSYTASVTEIKS